MRQYRRSCSQAASTRGSFCGRFAFMGKAVRGKLSVLFRSSALGVVSDMRIWELSAARRLLVSSLPILLCWNLCVRQEERESLQQTPYGTMELRVSQLGEAGHLFDGP